jgi:hypothetical protein
VVFDLNNRYNYQTENLYPYALFGNLPNNKYVSWRPAVGEYWINATPYSILFGKGAAGIHLDISFKVVDEQEKASPAGRKSSPDVLANENQEINLYPNPVKDKLTINLGENTEENFTIGIYDIMGRKVYVEEKMEINSSSIEINLSALPSGYYILQFGSATTNKTMQILKE